jgi:hypothetical protein
MAWQPSGVKWVQTEMGLNLRKNSDKKMRQAAINDKKFIISKWSMVIYHWAPSAAACIMRILLPF